MIKYKRYIYYFSLIATFIYLLFRTFFTLPDGNGYQVIFALIVLVVELIDAFFYFVYVLNILSKDYNVPLEPKIFKKNYPDLDVFIATKNEDVELVKKTIEACKKMKYPSKKKVHIYLCDDGNRKEMEELCKKCRICYITRLDNIDAKAGNYNNALKNTTSPYIAVFDADMVSNPDFLIKTVPYLFINDKVGFVQLPQSFYNPDIFQQKFKLDGYIPFEQDFFYHRIQMSKNNTNSVIFCGTNAILSREALEDIGGFARHTITEDFATGLLMEGHGFKGIALPYDEVYGKNVEDVSSFLKQRSRWCRGCIQTYKNYQIITNKGLSVRQKLDYLSGIYYWFFGFRNIFFLLVPLLFSFFDIKIVQGNLLIFIILFLIQYILKRFIIDKLEDRKISSSWNRIYETILSPIILLESFLEVIGLTERKFEVTEKVKNNKNSIKYYYLIFIHLLLFFLNIMGLYYSIIKGLNNGFVDYIIPIFWLSTNVMYLLFAIIFDFSSTSELYKKEKSCYKYLASSTIVLLVKFIVEEIKIKRIVIIVFILALLFTGINFYKYKKNVIISSHSLVSYNNWLSIDKGKIVNDKGKIVNLRGVSTHNLYWYGRVYTKENIKEIKNTWGVNVFRIAVYTNPNEKGYIHNRNSMKQVEEIIDYCIDLDIYVIVDWHILKDNNPNIYKKEAIEFFDNLSKKYNDKPNVIYEICNEPNGKDVTWTDDIKPYAEDIIKVIRKNSKKSLIIVGLADWCKDIESAMGNMVDDSRVLYSVHFYAGDSKLSKLRIDMNKAINNNMPLIVTECGAMEESGDGKLYKEKFNDWIKYLETNSISWIVWQLSEKDETSSLLIKKEVQDRLDFLYEKYTEEELKKKKYYINDYLSDTGKYIKNIFKNYN